MAAVKIRVADGSQIESRVRWLERDLAERLKDWGGSMDEFHAWVQEAAERALCNIAHCLYVEVERTKP